MVRRMVDRATVGAVLGFRVDVGQLLTRPRGVVAHLGVGNLTDAKRGEGSRDGCDDSRNVIVAARNLRCDNHNSARDGNDRLCITLHMCYLSLK